MSNCMIKQCKLLRFLIVLMLGFGMAELVSQVQAQQTSTSSQDASQAQSQQTQQQTRQQPAQNQQSGGEQQNTPSTQAGHTQTFRGQIVKVDNKYMLQDSSTGTSYNLEPQEGIARFEGKRVQVTGSLDATGKTIHMQSQ
jgi:uncharacterized protein HemX